MHIDHIGPILEDLIECAVGMRGLDCLGFVRLVRPSLKMQCTVI